ncbi:uncharacterized protein MONBRDRAFT_23303 [Monosiga brevicollis MX1]|uniref:J domain-containing protein n=1 Tax=Monosiga brevicollis TaxID=81824 RepID=A9UT02_MONBE|nr:uncharacterized protein MONBRDRAFT_23303 [Monosiga brevicollis MX1]EDQ91410.1 predicted protein [Monosiga brevicollis MX1]|eukprot:XP_001743832.1 hypothetical protein [Monosiga brevicollis MX1]
MTAADQKLDYYELLGVQAEANSDEIRRAFRKAALRYHPDKNQGNEAEAEAMFKLVAEAYEVLSDDSKRQLYDRYGHEGLGEASASASSGRAGPQFRDAHQLFREVFGDMFGTFLGLDSDFMSNMFDSPFNDPFFSGGMAGGSGFGLSPFGSSMMGGASPFGMGGSSFFGNMGGASPFGAMGGFSSSQSYMMSGGAMSGGGSFSSQSTSTSIRDGKRVTKTVSCQNGVTEERVEVRDAYSGQLLDLTVNGQPQLQGVEHASPQGYLQSSLHGR